jgi:molybdate transport system ATP-binding protein
MTMSTSTSTSTTCGPAVLDASFRHDIHPGLRIDATVRLGTEVGVLFGRSGAGKTTLLRLIAGLDRARSGLVRLGDVTILDTMGRNGRARVNVPLRHRRIGMIFQDDLLFPHLSVASNVRFGLAGLDRAEADARAAEVAGLCGIEALLDRRPETLSGGERQRVGLARALAPRPSLLLCDEPVSALDLGARFALLSLLRSLPSRTGVSVLVVTHSPAEAVAVGDRLFLLDRGRIIDEGGPLEVLARSSEPQAIEGLQNVLSGRVARHEPGLGETVLALDGGPELVVPLAPGRAIGASAVVAVRADDVLLARRRGPVPLEVSARNQIDGVVERVVPHGGEAEVVVRTGSVTWLVSVVSAAVTAIGLHPAAPVSMIIKARSCHLLAEMTTPASPTRREPE